MFSIFDLYPPGSRIMIFDIDILLFCCSIWPAKLCFNFLHYVFLFRLLSSRPSNYEFRFSIWHTRLLWITFGWWTGHRSKKATRNPGTRKTPALNLAAGSQSNVRCRGDIQRTKQMRQRSHPFNRTKQFLWGWFNTISSWLVVQCCGSLCGLYSASWETVLNLLHQAAALLVTDSDKVDCRHSNVSSRAEILHFGQRGRPRYVISEEKLEFLLDMKFTSGEIACMLYVSKSSVKRRIREYETFVRQRYSDISEYELDEIVEGIMREFPNRGYLRMTGLLQSGGYKIQQNRIRESMRRVNPDCVLLRVSSNELFAEDGIKSAVLFLCGILMVTTNW